MFPSGWPGGPPLYVRRKAHRVWAGARALPHQWGNRRGVDDVRGAGAGRRTRGAGTQAAVG